MRNSVLVFATVMTLFSSEVHSQQGDTQNENEFFIDFVGTANLQGSIAEVNEEVEGSAGLGVIYERYLGDRNNPLINSYDIESYINVASSVDQLDAITDSDGIVTNQRLFGSYVLNPISSKQSIFINSNVFLNPERDSNTFYDRVISQIISGVNFRVIASNSAWKLDNNIEKNLGVLSFRYGIFHEFLPDNKIRVNNRRKYSVYLGANLGWRIIVGDLSSDANQSIREQFLGTDDKNFSGTELTFGFRLNNIIAEFSMPSVGGSRRSDIEGLTDTQFLFSIRFIGGFSLKLNPDTNEN